MGRILIVYDEPATRDALVSILSKDHQVWIAATVEEARRSLGATHYDAVFAGQGQADGVGLETLAAVRQADPAISVVLLSATPSIELVVESMRRGAFDFLIQPWQPETVSDAAQRACENAARLREDLSRGYAKSRSEMAPALTEPVPRSFDLSAFLEQTEKDLILRALASAGGTQAEAARRLGLSRSALAYKLTKYGIRNTAN